MVPYDPNHKTPDVTYEPQWDSSSGPSNTNTNSDTDTDSQQKSEPEEDHSSSEAELSSNKGTVYEESINSEFISDMKDFWDRSKTFVRYTSDDISKRDAKEIAEDLLQGLTGTTDPLEALDKILMAIVPVVIPYMRTVGDFFAETKVAEDMSTSLENRVTAPDGWVSQPSKKGGGVLYRDTNNPHNNIRQMPGNPDSPNPAQQNPYVIFKKNGVAYDVNGSPLASANDPAAHIPLDQFDMTKMPEF